jgi:hypothetical protein
VLAGTAILLASGEADPVGRRADPLALEFARIARELRPRELEGEALLTEDDLMAALGQRTQPARLLDFYTREGIEYALYRYGILQHLRRLGYGGFEVEIARDRLGDRVRLVSRAGGAAHLLYEAVLEKRKLAGEDVLYVHWLTLRHPRGRFSPERPRLPGQDVPGLGIAREAGMLLVRIAERLGLAGVAFRPSWLHTAYPARPYMRFVDSARQGRFEALLRDLGDLRLLEATTALAEGRVQMNGEAYVWEADEMVHWLDGRHGDREAARAERERVRFEVTPRGSSSARPAPDSARDAARSPPPSRPPGA